jgi:hypothetical protein
MKRQGYSSRGSIWIMWSECCRMMSNEKSYAIDIGGEKSSNHK